jgi:hypothetical protein
MNEIFFDAFADEIFESIIMVVDGVGTFTLFFIFIFINITVLIKTINNE